MPELVAVLVALPAERRRGSRVGRESTSCQPHAREALVAKNHVITTVLGGAYQPHSREADGGAMMPGCT